ncbi:MAG: P-loop NTPase [Euryarchaeota archaeon]|nr:P-loop NTPase [Euryarchaeota archaeon]
MIDLFKTGGGGEHAAADMDVPFLGRIPIEVNIVESGDSGIPFVLAHESEASSAFETIVDSIEHIVKGNYSGMLIGLPIAILYFLTRKITAEGAEERRALNRLFPLCASLRTLRLNSLLVAVCPMSRIVPA